MKTHGSMIFALIAVVGMTCFWVGCSSKGEPVGLMDGTLKPCPDSPNCVSSLSRKEKSFCEPLRYWGSPEEAMDAVKKLAKQLGGELKKEEPGYLWFIFRSKTFRFKDDTEFLLVEEEDRIHVRSAARTGWYDFGKNRSRVREIREKFDQLNK